jgi:hypothetical protein
MCCGQKRSALQGTMTAPVTLPVRETTPGILSAPTTPRRSLPPALPSRRAVNLRYLQNSPIRVLGPITGRQYEFTASHPVQLIDPRDAPGLLRTRLFGRTA